MLNIVPAALRVAARAMVTRHPNAMDAEVHRRRVVRTEGAEAGLAGGYPTLGGLSVMDREDESEVDYDVLGMARVLFATQYEGTTMSDRRDSAEPMSTGIALIESDVAGLFEPRDGDLVMVMPGFGVVIPYEVTNVINAVNIPPYLQKYELSAQGDLLFSPEAAASQAIR